jgi:hypothetical protein
LRRRQNAPGAIRFRRAYQHFQLHKTGVGCHPYLLRRPKREIVMASSRIKQCATALGCAAASATCLLWAGAALTSQGPGTGPGTASHFTQLTMAVLVYGISALVVGAGLIGAVRRH